MRIGVADLGTNTFHLLIVDLLDNGNFKEVYRERKFIHLAENGIETIGNAPYERGMKTLNSFSLQMIKHKVDKYSVKGTAALRTATNGPKFLAEVKAQTGINIETITGDEEAKLIYYGVRQAVPLQEKPFLIIDVGGGSVEFIIANDKELLWAQSFPIGVAVLYRDFHHNEPISENEVNILETFLQKTLEPLQAALKNYSINTLVGASGTFDVLETAMTIKSQNKKAARVDFGDFAPFYKKVVNATYDERLSMLEVPLQRKRLIVVALILVNHVLKNFGLTEIIISNFAMKEGMIQEVLLEKNASLKNISR